MRPRAPPATLAGFVLFTLASLPTAFAHGGGMEDDMGASHESANSTAHVDEVEYPPTYFAHSEHVALLYIHIALMVVSWVFILPVAVMLSIAGSRYTILSQAAFIAANGLGVFIATLYNAQTPDLYPNNAHHSVGWVATWVSVAQFTVSVLSWLAKRSLASKQRTPAPERDAFLPVSSASEDTPERAPTFYSPYRMSDDQSQSSGSGHSLHSSSASTVIDDEEGLPMPSPHKEYDDDAGHALEEQTLDKIRANGTWTRRVVSVVSSRIWRYVVLAYKIVDRVVLPLGFIVLATGIVTMGRFFEGKAIFNGLAHWVKGGVFFWLGLFTLGRWSGSFGDLGWAWNMRPRSASTKWRPSAEFVESALIFFYGSTNVFLEHLGNWGGRWAPQDFEHLAITILFIGGGLCGMLIESTRIRDLLNVATVEAVPERTYSEEEEQTEKDEPSTYRFSLNPIPALVILLLGVMMSSHHQKAMISTMVHKQWGNLLVGASFARGLTYVLVFLRPPTSVLPSRPPTELLVSFGLIAGGIIFMASSADTIQGMIHYDLDAMFMYTVTMGLVGLLMAWELVVLAIKGLATRSERRAKLARF